MMRWSERRLAMLEAMGLRLWLPPASSTPAVVERSESAPRLDGDIHAEGQGDAAAVAGARRAVAPAAVRSAAALPRLDTPPDTRVADARADADPASVATMDWPTLRATVAGCTACRLCQSRRQTVFGVGHPQAHWMIVGEAPGEQEDQQGEPFVGKSGQLLDNMLRSIGLGRTATAGAVGAQDADADPARQVYICNTVKCRPPGNRNPEADELARCQAYLSRQIELVQPRIILAMGRFAVQSLLLSSEPIGRLRGRVHRYHDVPLIATYHPAYLLRNLEDKAKAWDDLCLAMEALQSAALPA